MKGETVVLVMPDGCHVRGAFHLPREVVSVRVVSDQGPYGAWGERRGGGG